MKTLGKNRCEVLESASLLALRGGAQCTISTRQWQRARMVHMRLHNSTAGGHTIEQGRSKSRATATPHNLTRYSFKSLPLDHDGASPPTFFIANIEVSYVLF